MIDETARLRLLPYSPAHLLALVEGYGPFARAFGLPGAEGLRDFVVSSEVSPAWLDQLRHSTAVEPWRHGFAVVHRGDQLVIGNASFTGPPGTDRVVEIAYGIVNAYQGRGYATEAAQWLVGFAFATDAVDVVRAHTLPVPNASTRVLTKCGFSMVGEVVHPEDGRVWRWERGRG